MTDLQIFDAEGDGSQDDGTLFSLSDEFLEAARVLQATPPIRVKYSAAVYYLLGHSVELMLKAFLYKRGVPVGALRKLNHDLRAIVANARESGLPEAIRLEHVLQLADAYKDKSFEYRTRRKKLFPSLDLLTEEIDSLQSVIFETVCK
jgi:hypothetical protein